MVNCLNGEQFDAALVRARKGDRIAYHVGVLMADRCYYVEADSVARAAWAAHEAKKVVLVQERVRPTACRYIAVVL